MLILDVGAVNAWDEATERFVTLPGTRLALHHSLATLSRWEELWEKPFLGPEKKTEEETRSYIRMMSQSPEFPPDLFFSLSEADYQKINKYLDAKMSATWFREMPPQPRNSEIVTSEIIYFWMISLTIPFECQHWHLNRLFTLIKVCNEKNQEAQKKPGQRKALTTNDLAARRALNEQRRKQQQTSG